MERRCPGLLLDLKICLGWERVKRIGLENLVRFEDYTGHVQGDVGSLLHQGE